MRNIFLLGGCCGFLLAGATGWGAGHAPDRLLLDAAVGCVIGAFLFRWFWTVLIRGIRETILERQRANSAPSASTK